MQFLGAAGMVTGSSYLLRDDANNAILVDMGVFQGLPDEEAHNTDPLVFDPRLLSAVILTHAHQDHCGRLPLLARNGFKGRIYMTPATRELLEISLLDSVKIAKEDSRRTKQPPAFDEGDVQQTLEQAVLVKYSHTFDISRYSIVLKDAGHILGSASIILTDNSGEDAIRRIVWSGDLGNTPQDLIRPTQYIDEADVVIMESTYGDRAHPDTIPRQAVAAELRAAYKRDSTVLIPAFSIERTQVLLHMIGHMKEEGEIPADLPVFLDSPMAQRVTDVYRQFPDLYSDELRDHARVRDPFDFPGLTVIEQPSESRQIKETQGAKVIIAGSGMMSGGRIMSHAKQFLPEKSTFLLIVGYQAEGTVGRDLIEGARAVQIYGEDVHVAATIRDIHGFSAHADQPRLLQWRSQINGVQTTFLTHGENGPRETLAEEMKDRGMQGAIIMPSLREEYTLGETPR